jgi:hypothetical protein
MKGFIGFPALFAIIVMLLAAGGGTYYYLQNRAPAPANPQLAQEVQNQTQAESTSTQQQSSTAPSATSQTNLISVPGMSQYTDADFGFSFWYPSEWEVREFNTPHPGVQTDGFKKELAIGPANHGGADYVYIDEITPADGKISDVSDGPGCTQYVYNSANAWIQIDCWKQPYTNTRADVSNLTMGGLPIFQGTAAIVPITTQRFVVVNYGTQLTRSVDATFLQVLARTFVGSGSTQVNVTEQVKTIQAEKDAYAQ